MGKGFDFVKAAAQDIENRKNSGGTGGKLYLKIATGESAIVRFLEEGQEVVGAWVHELPKDPGRQVGDKVPCRAYDDDGNFTGDDCPGCDNQYKRMFQGAINVIWRDAPLFKRDAEGKLIKENGAVVVVGKEDQVAVWVQGINTFESLAGTDAKYKGLKSRDFEISRSGEGYTTKYRVDPADVDSGPQPMSDLDLELEKNKYDLTSYHAKPSYEAWGKKSSAPKNKDTVVPADTSPFMRNRE